METERASQLAKLWEWLPRPTEEHVVRLFARDANGGVIGDYARSLRELNRFVESLDGSHNIYVGLNPTTSTAGTRHSASDVTHWSFFPVDVDPLVPDADPEAAMHETMAMIKSYLPVGDMTPIIIDSGRGRQLWYRIPDYRLVPDSYSAADGETEVTFKRLVPRRAMQYWLRRISNNVAFGDTGCRVDTSVSDLPRVMRCPGTINLKTGKRGSILSDYAGTFDTLGVGLVKLAPKVTFDMGRGVVVQSSSPWQMAYPHLTKRAQEYLTQGKEEPGRHATMWHTVKKLYEVGVSEEQARAAVEHANMILGVEQSLPDREIDKTISTIYSGG